MFEKLNDLLDRLREFREKPYAVLFYAAVSIAVLLPFMFFWLDVCILNFLIGVIAAIIPMKLFKEKDLKKIALAGVITILLMGLVGSSYHMTVIYDQEPETLNSENIVGGEISDVQKETNRTYRFEVTVCEDLDEYEVFVNLTSDIGGESENYTMMKGNSSENTYYYEFEAQKGKFYEHHFALNIEDGNTSKWEETDTATGPITVEKTNFLSNVFLNFTSISAFTFFAVILYKWLKGKREKMR